MAVDWKIRETSPDWECDWRSSEVFQLRYFRALSITEKFLAVENMCEVAEFFKRKAVVRNQLLRADSDQLRRVSVVQGGASPATQEAPPPSP